MRTSEFLHALANYLASPNNEAIMLAEQDKACLQIVAENCVLASELIRTAAEQVDALEPQEPSLLTPETIEETAALAATFDESNDPQLKKMASVLDELLLTIAAPPQSEMAKKKVADNLHIEELRRKYQDTKKELDKVIHTDEMKKAIDKSKMIEHFKVNDAPLQTFSCPDHPGAMMQRLGDRVWACSLDKKQYNFETGYTLYSGQQVPGGSVSHQTDFGGTMPFESIFSTRDGRNSYHQD